MRLLCVTEYVRELAGKRQRDRTEHEADRVEQQHGLAYVEPKAEDQLMVEVTAIGFGDTLSRRRAAHDRGRRIEHRKREHQQRHDDADRDRRLARADDRDGRKDVTDEERPGVAQNDARRIEIIGKKAERRAGQRDDDQRRRPDCRAVPR